MKPKNTFLLILGSLTTEMTFSFLPVHDIFPGESHEKLFNLYSNQS